MRLKHHIISKCYEKKRNEKRFIKRGSLKKITIRGLNDDDDGPGGKLALALTNACNERSREAVATARTASTYFAQHNMNHRKNVFENNSAQMAIAYLHAGVFQRKLRRQYRRHLNITMCVCVCLCQILISIHLPVCSSWFSLATCSIKQSEMYKNCNNREEKKSNFKTNQSFVTFQLMISKKI